MVSFPFALMDYFCSAFMVSFSPFLENDSTCPYKKQKKLYSCAINILFLTKNKRTYLFQSHTFYVLRQNYVELKYT